MTLKAQMSTDLTTVFLNSNDFAEQSTYQPQEVGSLAFSLLVVPGDASPAFGGFSGGTGQDAPVVFTAQHSDFTTKVTASLSIAREPTRGDLVTIATGQQAGVYVVETWQSDVGDGLSITAVRSDQFSVGADGARRL